jgi:oligopeptide transport system substrate-binding protein
VAALAVVGWLSPPALGDNRTLVFGNAGEPDTLDPHKYSLVVEQQILQDVFIGLTAMSADAQIVPGIAERWETSVDGLTWTFHLRPGLKWSDGVPLAAEDVVAGLRRAFDPKTAAALATFGYKIKGAQAVHQGNQPSETLGAAAVDPLTVAITLERPSLLLPQILADPQFFPLPRHSYAAHGKDWVKPGTMVSNGPYRLAAWRPNDLIRLVKNPNYVDAAQVAIEQIDYLSLDDGAAALKRFRAGELDVTTLLPSGQDEWIAKNLPQAMHSHPGSYLSYLAINLTLPKFQDPRVRRALSLAIDRETIVNAVLKSGDIGAYRIVPEGVAGYPENTRLDFRNMVTEARLTEARGLLAAAGYDEGNPLTFTFRHVAGTSPRRVAVVLEDAWRKIGAVVSVTQTDGKTHYQLLRSKDFEVATSGWTYFPDPEYFLTILESDNAETNYGSFADKEFDHLILAAKVALDPSERLRLFGRAEKLAMEQYPIAPLAFLSMKVLVADRVEGIEANALGLYPVRFVRLKH